MCAHIQGIDMFIAKLLHDPLGNTIQIPGNVSQNCCRDIHEITRVITSPAFIIKERNQKIYFFKLVAWEVNVLVEVRFQKKHFVVSCCQENPSAEYISTLLKKGSLVSFL
jgi:hypothetical protein